MAQTVDLFLEVSFHLVVQRLDGGFLLGLFHDLADTLALCHLQFLGEIVQHRRQIARGLLGFRHLLGLPLQFLVELHQHSGGAVRQLAHIALQ